MAGTTKNGASPVGYNQFYLQGNGNPNLPVVSRQPANDEYRLISREDIEEKLASHSKSAGLVKT